MNFLLFLAPRRGQLVNTHSSKLRSHFHSRLHYKEQWMLLLVLVQIWLFLCSLNICKQLQKWNVLGEFSINKLQLIHNVMKMLV